MTGLFYTGDEDDVDSEAGIDYGMVGTFEPGKARIALGFTGGWIASADEGSFTDNARHHIGLNVDAALGSLRPGVSLRLPVENDFREVVGPSIGLYLQSRCVSAVRTALAGMDAARRHATCVTAVEAAMHVARTTPGGSGRKAFQRPMLDGWTRVRTIDPPRSYDEENSKRSASYRSPVRQVGGPWVAQRAAAR